MSKDKKSVTLEVESVRKNGNYTLLKLNNGDEVKLRPYLYVKPGNRIEFIPNTHCFSGIYKIINDRTTGEIKKIKLYPPYRKKEVIHVPPHKFVVTFRERLNYHDWGKAKELEQFHYRGKGFNKIVGRRTALIAEDEKYGVVGFGILSATVPAVGPRFRLFNCNFTEQMRSGLINQIARIPRIVIHPEFRGMGLGVLVAKHLVQYAKEYWDINNSTPIVVEVIAAMIEYHKFFEKAGFVNVGYTANYEKAMMPRYGSGAFESRQNFHNYDFMKQQKPKPYLVYPLTTELKNRIKKMAGDKIFKKEIKMVLPNTKLKKPIEFKKVCVTYKVKNGSTKRTSIVKEVFGVDSEQAFSTVIKNFSLIIQPGDVVLITGASGSGKSTVLKLLTSPIEKLKREIKMTGEITGHDLRNIAVLSTHWDESLPLVEQVKKGKDIKEAIELLNSLGLTEAYLYIKHPNQISDGQRYRFAMAKLCDSEKPVWIADEFVSTLNSEMAAIVAKGIRKLARKYGTTLILAAPHITGFVQSLLPNKLVRLTWGGKTIIHSLKANYTSSGKYLILKIVNTCKYPLTSINIGKFNRKGGFGVIFRIEKILPGKNAIIEAKLAQFIGFSGLKLRTAENIGDVIYF